MTDLETAAIYYRAFEARSDFSEVPFAEKLRFRGPNGEVEGAGTLRPMLAGLAARHAGLAMRHQVAAEGQVISVYDFDLSLEGGAIPMAERLEIRDAEIVEVELLFDAARMAP
ncbi:MAG: hypothetical protein AAGC67_20155 [Myxococcota bacterium]